MALTRSFRDAVATAFNATIGFPRLSELTSTPAKSLLRMLAPGGNPQARNLCAVLDHLQRETGVRLTVSVAA